MKPTKEAIEAARQAYCEAAVSPMEMALEAAYDAQFQSEDYAGLVERLRAAHRSNPIERRAADAIEAVLAERDTYKNWLDNYENQFAAKVEELVKIRLERDALAARLAPVEDEALAEIVADAISDGSKNIARAAIAAIRPHIEAAERERCAKIADDCDKSTHPADVAAAIRREK